MLAPIEKVEKEIDQIVVKFQKPLEDVDLNLASYHQLLRLFDEFTRFDSIFCKGLLEKVKNHDTLSGAELFTLRKTVTTYYKINKKMLDFAKVYDFGGFLISRDFVREQGNLPLIKAHLLWLSGHLLVLDHLERMHEILYESDANFRRIVKNALMDKGNSENSVSKTLKDLIKMNQYSVEIGESPKFSQQIYLVRSIHQDLKVILQLEPLAYSLVKSIVENQTAIDLSRGNVHFKMKNFSFVDSISQSVNKITGWLSEIFGNMAGAISWRSGYLYQNSNALKQAILHLQPMDVLLEKSPFILTDKFIPGHYGHAAIYLGTKKQLESIGMWNHPDIIPYQKAIASGKTILEAVRSGVRLNSIEEFLNIDQMTIVRKKDALTNENLLIEEITRGMDQIGKEYDFNFDISTLDKIVCSELIYIFYGHIHWPTEYRIGRPIITPDHVAEILFQKNSKFHIVDFMVANTPNRIEKANLDYLAHELDYELRKNDGSPIENKNDPTNSYWKKETKCFNVADGPNSTNFKMKRICKTDYKEFYYEERESI